MDRQSAEPREERDDAAARNPDTSNPHPQPGPTQYKTATASPELDANAESIREAFELFTKTTASMEESYRRLEARVQSLDQELQSKNQELALTTDYLNSILDSMSDGVIAIDIDGLITTFNRAAVHVLGYAPDDVIGQQFHTIFGCAFPGSPTRMVMELPSATNKDVPVSTCTSPIADRSGAHIGSVAVFQDLREIEELRRRMRQKEHLATIGEMTATVAHEIRNPLGGIRGFATLLQRDLQEDDPRSRLVQKILTGTTNLERVVNELLEFTRPITPALKTADSVLLVDAAIGYLETGNRTIDIKNNVDAQATVVVDAQQMRQVLLNILINAVQSIEDEGAITITSQSDDTTVTLIISDTGCGIPDENLDSVFSPFYTTKEKGTGLGLAVASKIVESHGGTLEVSSRVGSGSAFKVKLPRGT